MAEYSPSPRDGDTCTLAVSGELDIASVDGFLEAARTCLATGAPVFVIDFADVDFIDSSGLGALVRLRKDGEAQGTRIELASVPRSVSRLLTVTGLDELFPDHAG